MNRSPGAVGASFRDPAGFVFKDGETVRRKVTFYGRENYDRLISSGLYEELVEKGWLVGHEVSASTETGIYKVLTPEPIDVITYPYEWCFSQLQDAAVRTLEIQLTAIERGMSLKDATPFNIQWRAGAPVLIDTLSFENLQERPWFGYKQFCESFLAPLALMAQVKADFNKYLRVDLGGINLSFTSHCLPRLSWLHPGVLAHIHLHALSQEKFDRVSTDRPTVASMKFSKSALTSLVRSLLDFTSSLRLKKQKTVFGDYYSECAHYSREAEESKTRLVETWAGEAAASAPLKQVVDLGSNNGKFSRLFTKKNILCLSVDSDPFCVDENYSLSKKAPDPNMLPILMDLANPSSDLGWGGGERDSFFKRVNPGLVMALALVHHLRIGNNVPTEMIADFFREIAPSLIIEFVPKEDPMVRKLLANRDDIFHDYDTGAFEAAFGRGFEIVRKASVAGTSRILYYLNRKK